MVWRNSIVSPEGFRYFLLVFNSLQDTGTIVFPSWFDSSKMGYVVLVKLDGGYMIVGVDGPDTTEDWVPEIGYAFKDVHTVTFSCTHGSVGATIDGVAIVSPCIVPAGKSVVFTITPDEGYEYTGTNPETVLVNADVTKVYVCTEVASGPACIKFEYSGEYYVLGRDESKDDDNPGVEGVTKMYAWVFGGENIYGTASDNPSVGDSIWEFYEGVWDRESSLTVSAVAIGYCCTAKLEEGGNITIFGGSDPVESSSYEGYYQWYLQSGVKIFYTQSITPSVGDMAYTKNSMTSQLEEFAPINRVSNITE